MKLFRKIPPQASAAARTKDHAAPEPFLPGQALRHQHAQSQGDSESTKADEMMRLMSERKERHKRAW